MTKAQTIRTLPAEFVPPQISNVPAAMLKKPEYGKGYVYVHDTKEKLSKIKCLPNNLADKRYYLPTEEGNEKAVKKRVM
ncbi:MAG: hypothetical protein K2N90_05605 [Lachnospiraceae bacterium]|nr:hypothetical protein [Lachnospiraceae bacterium]